MWCLDVEHAKRNAESPYQLALQYSAIHRWSAVHMQQLHVQAYELYLRTNIGPVFYVGPYTKILMSCAYLFMHTALSLGIQILEDKSGLVSQK